MNPIRHILSAVSISAITLNLSFWMMPLIAIAIARPFLTWRPIRSAFDRATGFIYRRAAAFNGWWLTRLLRIDLNVVDKRKDLRDRNLIIICNHRSWFDILVLHSVIIEYTPIIKFLIKRQLIWVPILGWICLALDFPRLYRTRDPENRDRDYNAIARATSELNEQPLALLNFAEGTRFTPEKRDARNSPYRHLLDPKVGGLRIMLDNTEDTEILDMTLAYPAPDYSFWRCISGELNYVKVYLHYRQRAEIGDPAEWLRERWRVKDRLIAEEFEKNRS